MNFEFYLHSLFDYGNGYYSNKKKKKKKIGFKIKEAMQLLKIIINN